MICSSCGFENNDTAKFCNECGMPLKQGRDENEDEAAMPDSADHPLDAASEQEEPDTLDEPLQETAPLQLPTIHHDDEEEFDFSPLDGESSETSEPHGVAEPPQDTAVIGTAANIIAQKRTLWHADDTMEMPRLDDEPAPASKDFRITESAAPAKGKKKGKKVAVIVVILVLVLAAAGIGATYMMEIWGGKTIPDVVGKSRVEATQALEAKGFVVKTLKVKSDDTEDMVLLMDPTAGRRAQEGSEIVLQVSTSRVVPDIVGKSLEDAQKALGQEGFEKVEYVKVKSNDPENTILSVDPGAGTKAKAATPITVKVTEAYKVPDTIGKDEETAVALLKQEGYTVTVNTVYSEATEGTVVTSNPAAGTKLASGSTVTIEVAKSRSKELISLTASRFAAGQTFTANNAKYQVVSNDGISYMGGNKVQTVLTVREGATLSDGEVVWGSARQKTFTILWTDANSISSIS